VLARRLIRLQCYEGIDASSALYEWNYPRQMLAIRQAGEQSIDIYGEPFLIERPMLAALRSPDSTVLLIDEIDRSDQEFEAFLLEFLSDFQISIPERGTIRAAERPIVVLTSNRTRDLHEALRRRCVYHWIDYPNAEREARIVMLRRAELHRPRAECCGLSEVKRAVAELEDQIEVRALRLAAGLPVTNQTNHMLLVGPPGTGKTTTAEALGKIYAGLGIVRHPEIIEVKRSDFCGEHIGASGPRTNELIARSLGRILFMDEFYSLVERHHDGRPDMIGMEAVNQLLVALEVHRFDFCFIGAGYEKEVDEFLTVNPGLAGRFNRKLRFESYAPDELVEIAVRYGAPRATVIEPAAREALNIACKTLRAYLAPNGSHGIDVMQNGRFARNVVERAERLRDSRVAAQHRTDKGSVTVEDLETLRTQDIVAAVVDACAEKHVPVQL